MAEIAKYARSMPELKKFGFSPDVDFSADASSQRLVRVAVLLRSSKLLTSRQSPRVSSLRALVGDRLPWCRRAISEIANQFTTIQSAQRGSALI
jgi:hypothetical protein